MMKICRPSTLVAIGLATAGVTHAASPVSPQLAQFVAHPTHCAVWLGGSGYTNEQMSTTAEAVVAALGSTASRPELFAAALKDLTQRCRVKKSAQVAPAKVARPGVQL
jgi:hypothetical protein